MYFVIGKNIKQEIMQLELSHEDRMLFQEQCANWQNYVTWISSLDKTRLFMLLNYLLHYRPHSKSLIQRAVSKFNKKNKLTVEDLT